jgi:pimeloyl-ACP methyl ester carboxylesterase
MTHLRAQSSPSRGNIILIPGGPGLSSNTLRPLDGLAEYFDLHYVDLPGCNGVPFDPGVSFDSVVLEIISECDSMSGPLHVLGHSFGGIFAAKVALALPAARSLVCLATPFQ